MTPEQAAAIRAAYNRQIIPTLYPRNTPEHFHYTERYGPPTPRQHPPHLLPSDRSRPVPRNGQQRATPRPEGSLT